jgi:CheY-like chemotaxis protein
MNHAASGIKTAGTILVADDTPNYRHALQRLLVAKGYAVLTASNGESALQLAREQSPDLILTKPAGN